MGFRDVVPSYFDPYLPDEEDDPTRLRDAGDELFGAPPRRRIWGDAGNVADERRALQQTIPETQSALTRLKQGVAHDAGDLGMALASPIYYGAREVYRTATHPLEQLDKYSALVDGIANDPYAAVTKIKQAAGAAADAFVEPYTPREGEGILDVAKRNVLDRPLSTLMDASMAVGIPAGLAERAGIEGATMFADAARAMDPISLATKAAKGLIRTKAPDAFARMEAASALADLAAEQKTRATAIHAQFKAQTAEVFAGLEPAEKALFFPYTEGRLKTMTEGASTGQLGELTPEGVWAPHGVDAGRTARLEAARQKYLPVLDQFELQMGYKPEQYAQQAMASDHAQMLKQGIDPLSPEGQQRSMDLFAAKTEEARIAADSRRTISTRTSLTAAKTTEFNAAVEKLKLEQPVQAITDRAAQWPVQPATVDEALEVMGPQGGVYFPHSGEVFTREQSTFGNVLTKVRESIPFKKNEGALYRSGALDQLDPEAAILRTHVALQGGAGRAEILDQVGQMFGEKLAPGYKFGTDADFRAGTHQLLRPGLLHQEGALQEHMQDFLDVMMKNADDPAVAALNLQDIVTQAAGRMDGLYPLKADAPVYKIRKGTGDAIKAFTKQFEPTTNPLAQKLDQTVDPFNFVTLNLRPARIVNNLIGNTLFQVLQGIHPFSTNGIGAISDMVKVVGYKAGLTGSENARKLAQVFDLPGVKSGGLLDYESRTATWLKGDSALAKVIGGKGWAAYGKSMANVNDHVESSARALSTLFELRKGSPGLMGRMATSAKATIDLGDRLTELKAMGAGALDAADYKASLKNVNRFLNDYGRTTATERMALRRVFPYHKFYKHSLELALRTPFEQPAKTALLRTIGKAAQQDIADTLNGWGFDPVSMQMPWQKNSIPIDLRDDGEGPNVRLINLQGPNPFSLLSVAAEGDPGREGLAALHPAMKAAFEVALGINLFTMQPFESATTTYGNKQMDPRTGQITEATIRPGPIAQFSKQFWPVQLARDVAAGGRQPFDSVSFADMLRAQFGDLPEGQVYKTNQYGEAERRPRANPYARLFLPTPQTLQAPTERQLSGQTASISEQYHALGRVNPEMQAILKARRQAAARERRSQPKPYRVKPRDA